jgi:hypothetical protein
MGLPSDPCLSYFTSEFRMNLSFFPSVITLNYESNEVNLKELLACRSCVISP